MFHSKNMGLSHMLVPFFSSSIYRWIFLTKISAAESLHDLHAVQEDNAVQSAAAEVQQAHLHRSAGLTFRGRVGVGGRLLGMALKLTIETCQM